MLLVLLLTVAALTPGVLTALRLRNRGWPLALLAGAGVALSVPFILLSSLVVFPPLGIAVAVAAVLAALAAYDDGRVWYATAWAALAVVACACAGWSR
ncbi:hypothetical protein [Streptomyces antibioticus]|uniref:hypothetical protein n=1 Tax=Streptomyces antibioticus TaxID=1890 RepID=UPI0036F94EB4